MNEEADKNLFWYRVKLVAVVLVFLSPFVGGWLAVYVFEWRPPSGNYGELVQPVRKVDWPAVASLEGVELETGIGRKWAFLLFANDGCAEQCRENVYYMRQIKILLGRNSNRLQNLLVSSQSVSEDLREFLQDYPRFLVIESNRSAELFQQFQLDGLDPVGNTPRMYLVDPDRNFMMYFPPQSDEYKVLDDLKKLMKLSQIG